HCLSSGTGTAPYLTRTRIRPVGLECRAANCPASSVPGVFFLVRTELVVMSGIGKSGHSWCAAECPLLGEQRTSNGNSRPYETLGKSGHRAPHRSPQFTVNRAISSSQSGILQSPPRLSSRCRFGPCDRQYQEIVNSRRTNRRSVERSSIVVASLMPARKSRRVLSVFTVLTDSCDVGYTSGDIR